MHDQVCALRNFWNGSSVGGSALGAPDADRADPFGSFLADWQELIAFDITVNATTEEGISSRLINGPFLIEEVGFRSSAAGGSSQQLRIGVGDTSPGGQAVVGSDSGLPTSLASDSSRTVGTFYAANVYERHQMRWLSQSGTARLQFVLNNTTAGAVTVVGHVLITHLRAAPLAVTPR
jgi:hypothetical protein